MQGPPLQVVHGNHQGRLGNRELPRLQPDLPSQDSGALTRATPALFPVVRPLSLHVNRGLCSPRELPCRAALP